jgi:hypothetical protein
MCYSNYNELFIPISIDSYCKKHGVQNHDGMIICTNEYEKWILYDTTNRNQTLIELPYNIKVGGIFIPSLIPPIIPSTRYVFSRFIGYKIMNVFIKYGYWCVRFDYNEYINKPPIIITEEKNNKFLNNNIQYHYF